MAAAIRLTACRAAARGGDESRAHEPPSFVIDANAAAAALHALRDAPFGSGFCDLAPIGCCGRPARVAPLLALAPPVALGPEQRAPLAKLAGARPRLDGRLDCSAPILLSQAATPRLWSCSHHQSRKMEATPAVYWML